MIEKKKINKNKKRNKTMFTTPSVACNVSYVLGRCYCLWESPGTAYPRARARKR